MKTSRYVLALSAVLLIASPVFAQDKSATAKTDTAPESSESDEGQKEELSASETRVAIGKLLRERKAEEALKALDEASVKFPKDDSIRMVRMQVAMAFLSKRNYPEAEKQIQQLVKHQIDNAENRSNQMSLRSSMSIYASIAARTKNTDQCLEDLDRALEAVGAAEDHPLKFESYSGLVAVKAQQLAGTGDSDAAKKLLKEQLAKLEEVEVDKKSAEVLAAAKSNLLYTAASMQDADPESKSQLASFIEKAIKDFPDSSRILGDYARAQMMLVATSYRDDPEGAQEMIENASKVFEQYSDSNVAKAYAGRIKSYERRIESALLLKAMIGKPAPKMQIESWVNQGEVTEESLEGKVVLIDFWSVWCGPCIATFPHLRDLHDEFNRDGFEIVGVTRYYNYEWSESANRAVRSKGEVSPEDEQEMLSKFMEHHDLRHPTIVTPKNSTMQKEFGVTGIPHAVVLDRKGVVRLVKVGSGPQNAKEIHEMVAKLIDEK